jgi:Ca2+-binding EF-hand superfamily protein
VEEFARVMKASGQNPTDTEVQQIIKEVDLDGDGTINFEGKSARSIQKLAFRFSLLARPPDTKFFALN